jgi:hypothetical protein
VDGGYGLDPTTYAKASYAKKKNEYDSAFNNYESVVEVNGVYYAPGTGPIAHPSKEAVMKFCCTASIKDASYVYEWW